MNSGLGHFDQSFEEIFEELLLLHELDTHFEEIFDDELRLIGNGHICSSVSGDDVIGLNVYAGVVSPSSDWPIKRRG